MTDAVETMAFANELPWHGMGVQVKPNITPAAMLKAAKLDWGVVKSQTYIDVAGKMVKIDGQFALVRDSDNQILSPSVGAKYKPVQNVETLNFFKEFCEAGKMTLETAGSLWNGRYVWALARLGKDFSIGKGDEVRPYVLIMSPHVFGKALIMQYTPIRVVCWNTLNLALGSSLKGDGTGFRMPHSRDFKVEAEVAKQVLGLASKQTDEFKAASIVLSKKKATKEKVEEYFCRVLDFDPKDKEVKAGKVRTPVMLPKFRAALERAPGADMITAKGTWWGALNAVTYIVDHDTGRDRQTALKNAWIGNHANTKRQALELAIEYAK